MRDHDEILIPDYCYYLELEQEVDSFNVSNLSGEQKSQRSAGFSLLMSVFTYFL